MLNFDENALGNIMIIVGLVFLFVGFFLITPFNQEFSVVTLFSGVALSVFGLAMRLGGPLMLSRPSKSTIGTILICVSIVMIAVVGISVFYAIPTGMRAIEQWTVRGGYMGTEIIIDALLPLFWLSEPIAIIALGLLVMGTSLKIYDTF